MEKREIVLIDREFTYCKMFELLRLEHKTGNIHLMKFIAKNINPVSNIVAKIMIKGIRFLETKLLIVPKAVLFSKTSFILIAYIYRDL